MPYANSMGQPSGYGQAFNDSAMRDQRMREMQFKQQRLMMMDLLRQRAGRSFNQRMMNQMAMGGLGSNPNMQMPMMPLQGQMSPELEEMFRGLE